MKNKETSNIIDKKIKLFIYCSCVSRDILEITNTQNFEVIDYFARSSFASIGAKPIISDYTTDINNGFLDKSLQRDLDKSIFNSIRKNNFDVLLIDLIDDRFHIVEYENSYCTKSTLFANKLLKKEHRTIRFDTEEKFELWKFGVDSFFTELKKLNITNKVLISKIFHAEYNEKSNSCTNEMHPFISLNNHILNKMYNYISKYINSNQFLMYSDNLTIANSKHKWGEAPFHYIDDFYFAAKQQIENYYLKSKIKKRKHE